jgi:hypothetical protein
VIPFAPFLVEIGQGSVRAFLNSTSSPLLSAAADQHSAALQSYRNQDGVPHGSGVFRSGLNFPALCGPQTQYGLRWRAG